MRSNIIHIGTALCLLAVVPNVEAQEAPTATYFEGFEAQTALDVPAGDFYTATTTGSNTFTVTALQANSGNQSLRYNEIAANGAAGLIFPFDICGVAQVDLSIRSTVDTTGSVVAAYGQSLITDPTASTPNLVQFIPSNPTGSTTIRVTSSTGATVAVAVGGLANDAWHTYSIRDINCTAGSLRVVIEEIDFSQTFDTASGTLSELDTFFMAGPSASIVAVQSLFVDDLRFIDAPITAPVITAGATATVSGLTGFAVDPTGAAIIARTDGGDFVRTYSGSTMQNLGNEDTNCSKTGGVASQGNYVTYFTCDVATPSVPELLKIRTAGLSSVGQPGDCNRGNFCVEDILMEPTLFSGGIKGDQDNDNYLALFETFPIDFSQIRTSGSNRALMAWAFADAGGRIGVFTYTHINNDFDSSDIAETSIASQLPDQICTHRDSTGTSYLYASSTSSNAYGFRVGFEERGIAIAAEDNYALMPLLTQVFSGPIPTAGARGIGCAEGKFAVLTDDSVYIWNRNLNSGQATGTPITINGLSSVPTAGVAMSYNGAHTVYVSGGSWHLLNITGSKIATGVLPTGDFKAIELYGTCGSVLVATSTTIALYDVQSVCGNLTVFQPVRDLNDIDGDGIPNQFDPDIDGDGIPNEIDPDIDGDGIPNALDQTPNGASGGTDPDARPTSGPGSGLIDVDATNSIYFSLGTILLLAVLGWALVTGRGRRDG